MDRTNMLEMKRLLQQVEAYSDQDLMDFSRVVANSVDWEGHVDVPAVLQMRASVELIRAVRRFDEASGRLVETTNDLTRQGLWLSGVAIVIAFVSLAIALFKH